LPCLGMRTAIRKLQHHLEILGIDWLGSMSVDLLELAQLAICRGEVHVRRIHLHDCGQQRLLRLDQGTFRCRR
ncbi:MAG: hypothetical protein QOD29_3967, partial [Alphaproteobacteria bacterium]|nr:hypothetical protein [Alphaproteobacteria bacterium]